MEFCAIRMSAKSAPLPGRFLVCSRLGSLGALVARRPCKRTLVAHKWHLRASIPICELNARSIRRTKVERAKDGSSSGVVAVDYDDRIYD